VREEQQSVTTETTEVSGRKMDKLRHPQVIRTWKVERIRKPPSGAQKKRQQVRPMKKSK
jgi:hypothetical protein